MSQSGGTWTLTAVQLASAVNSTVVLRRQRTLSDRESQDMLVAVSGFGLWNRRDFGWDPNVEDGAHWIAEGRLGSNYHPLLLINSNREAIEKLAGVFLTLAGFDPIMLREGVEVSGS